MPPKRRNHAEELEGLWNMLETALNEVDQIALGKRDTKMTHKLSRSMWYQKCYGITSSDVDTMKTLHSRMTKWVQEYLAPSLKERISPAIQHEATGGIDSTKLFAQVAKVYDEFKISKAFGESIASNLDQGLMGRDGIPKMKDMYLASFHGLVYDDVKKPLRDCILRKVISRREGNQIDMKELRNATEFLITVGTSSAAASQGDELYSADFEQPYIQSLVDYYTNKAQLHLAQEGGHYTYLHWVEHRFELERTLAIDLLKPCSHQRVMHELETILLAKFQDQVIKHPDSGLQSLLEDWKTAEIHRMYTLFCRVPESVSIKVMGEELMTKLLEVVAVPFTTFDNESPSNDKALVVELLNIHSKYSNMVKTFCQNSADLHRSIKEAFMHRVNNKMKGKYQKNTGQVIEKETTFALILCVYVDSLMRGEIKIADPEEEVETLEKLCIQFNHLKEKDFFQEEHRGKLAGRLLGNSSTKEDLEKQFLQMLQKSMGSSFTYRMEQMIHDISAAKTSCDEFDKAHGAQLPCQFDCRVLGAGSWPGYKPCELQVHSSLDACMKMYTLYYKTRYATRELKWIHTMGGANLYIKFPKGPKDVQCSTYQAHILLLLDEHGKLSLSDIAAHLRLDLDRVVKPNIQSMYQARQYPILCTGFDEDGKTLPAAKEMRPDTCFLLNPNFIFKLRKLKVPALVSGGGGSVSKEEIDSRRKTMIDACIVRVMKSRRVLDFNELVRLVVEQLQKIFTPQPKHIKMEIEELINKGYLKRDPEAQNKFEYLA